MADGSIFPGLSQRLPPSNLQAEQALLGALFHNNKALDKLIGLEPFHFADPIHGRVFSECRKLITADRIANALTLKVVLENSGVLDEAGGTVYLVDLMSATVGIINAVDYAKVIIDTWTRRQLIDIGERVVNNAFGVDPDLSAADIVSDAIDGMMVLGETDESRAGTDFAAAAQRAVARSEAAYRGDAGQTRLDTGLSTMDALWGGLWPGQLYYLMARSRTGKTPAMMQIARHVGATLRDEADQSGKPPGHVHVFSLEMTAEDLLTINLASTTGWTSDQIRAGDLGDRPVDGLDPWAALTQSALALGRLPIFIDDQAEMDIAGLILKARAVARQRHTRLICVDYRELIRRGRDHTKMGLPEWVPFLGYQLKAMAKSLNVPVIALAQINKMRAGEAPRRPTLDDLPYDGGQAADGVFALHRPELYHAEEEPPEFKGDGERQATLRAAWFARRDNDKGVAEFGVLKRRFGPANLWKRLRFDGPRMLLSEKDVAPTDPDLLMDPPEWVTA